MAPLHLFGGFLPPLQGGFFPLEANFIVIALFWEKKATQLGLMGEAFVYLLPCNAQRVAVAVAAPLSAMHTGFCHPDVCKKKKTLLYFFRGNPSGSTDGVAGYLRRRWRTVRSEHINLQSPGRGLELTAELCVPPTEPARDGFHAQHVHTLTHTHVALEGCFQHG